MPTRAGWLVLVGSLAALAGGRAIGALELFVLGATGLAVVAVALVWVRRPMPALALHRRAHPVRPFRGAPARVEVEVANGGTRRTPVLTLHDAVEGTVGARLVVAPLRPGDAHQLGYRLPTGRRGRLEIGPLTTILVDPFGLARRRSAGPSVEAITVLPAIDPLGGAPAGAGRQEPLAGASSRAIATTGIEDLATLRPYVVGDDLRRIHWPSSARADDLLVRRDEERWQGHLTVVVDLDPTAVAAEPFEQAVSAAASLVHAVAEAGDRVRLVAGALDSGMVDARRAEPSLLEQLAHLDQGGGPLVAPAPDPGRRTALVVLTGPGGPTAAVLRSIDPAVVVVRFGATTATEPGALAVGPGDRFAAVWSAHLARRATVAGSGR